MIITADKRSAKYAPIPVGNGDLSLMIDYTGSNDCTDSAYSLHRAGVRQQRVNALLFPFGRITQKFCGNENEIVSWTQSLNTDNGLVSAKTIYKNGTELESEVFCHLEKNIIAFRKKRRNSPGPYTLQFECGHAPRMHYAFNGNGLNYFFDGITEYRGKIEFRSQTPARYSFENGVLTVSMNSAESDLFLCFENGDSEGTALEFNTLLQDSANLWKEFRDESYVNIPDENLMQTYLVSKYHLRINQTRWGMPVGLFNSHFGGRYFAFDEFFCAHALASCGHFSLLKKIIDFRYNCLQWARYRANGYYQDQRKDARWEWETLENFEDGSLCGHWQDHIFHMAHIALETYYYCIYSNDNEYLREKGIPILEGCAEFYMNQAVIRLPDERCIITKCTDLERFGPGRENAFLTTCGVMATLKTAAECFNRIGYRRERAAQYLTTVEELRKSLPQNDQLYFAVPQNDQKSVAVLGGIYPYDNILGFQDTKLQRSIQDFLENDQKYGSMYPHLGTQKICCWYASWESIVLSRCGDWDHACQILQEKMDHTGTFHQIYEIYDANRLPWFATGEGIFIEAVNELLLPYRPSSGHPIQGPNWKHYSFKLRSPNGKQITFEK